MIQFQPFGDSAVMVSFGDVVSLEVHQQIKSFVSQLEKEKYIEFSYCIPAYTTVIVVYDCTKISYDDFILKLKKIPSEINKELVENIVKIPVCYDACFSPDMEEVMLQTGLSKKEIIRLHIQPKYTVYMLGFTPGFFYLGGLSKKLTCTRKEIPRLQIEKGSVGIGGAQTGVYTVNSPGGWQLIGKTPLTIFDVANNSEPFLVKMGDLIQFYEITKEEFLNFQQK